VSRALQVKERAESLLRMLTDNKNRQAQGQAAARGGEGAAVTPDYTEDVKLGETMLRLFLGTQGANAPPSGECRTPGCVCASSDGW
jgi:hypothetical protein